MALNKEEVGFRLANVIEFLDHIKDNPIIKNESTVLDTPTGRRDMGPSIIVCIPFDELECARSDMKELAEDYGAIDCGPVAEKVIRLVPSNSETVERNS